MPGVAAVAISISLPGVPGQYQVELNTVEGRAETETKILAESRVVTSGYFATMRIPLLAGEMCRDESTTATMMVNRTFANTYLTESGAIGRHLLQPGNSSVGAGVSVAGDSRCAPRPDGRAAG